MTQALQKDETPRRGLFDIFFTALIVFIAKLFLYACGFFLTVCLLVYDGPGYFITGLLLTVLWAPAGYALFFHRKPFFGFPLSSGYVSGAGI